MLYDKCYITVNVTADTFDYNRLCCSSFCVYQSGLDLDKTFLYISVFFLYYDEDNRNCYYITYYFVDL